jgi:hypothetical protein
MPTKARRSTQLLLTLATVSALTFAASAQTNDSLQSQPAPVERIQPVPMQYAQQNTQQYAQGPQRPAVKRSQPTQGVWLSVNPEGHVTTVAATADRTELSVIAGVANVMVHHPAHGSMILVDLGGGQIDLIKDGLYTFNAQTKTARVLVGEAEAFPAGDGAANSKPIKVKEDHALTFGGVALKSVEFQPFQAASDLLPRNNAYARNDGGYRGGYGYGPYGDGFYGGYPAYAYGDGYGYGFGWDYPYGFYPGYGLGFGYYGGFGGFYGGGFRGGFGGFHGGRR